MNSNTNRILSLDVFRGLTMALMVLVNSPGTNYSYPILEHADWTGCTLADLVFPAFLFIVGVTTVISLSRQVITHHQQRLAIYKSILKRSVLLFALGLLLNAFPYHFDFATIRVYGVLQRIALCYLVCSILYLNTSLKTQIVMFVAILVGYWCLIMIVPVPGYGYVQLGIDYNWVAYIDKLMFSPAHLYKDFEPEGLLSTVPSIATTLAGVFIGRLLLTQFNKPQKLLLMLLIGIAFLLVGWVWSGSFPINKRIWTSSFVLWTGGISLIVFALCFLLTDILGYTRWALPFKIFGMNALFIYLVHVFLLKTQFAINMHLRDGTPANVKAVITDYLFGGFNPEFASLLYALSFLLVNFLIAAYLYKRKIFFKL